MTSADAGNQPSRCSACREPIRAGARLCPHCGTNQHPSRWHHVSAGLKWLGGIVTVITLVAGVVTLSGHYRDWRDERRAVSELAAAAEWLQRTANYRHAWETYERVLVLKPGHTAARRGRFELAQRWLRDFSYRGENLAGLLDEITAVLYQGLPGSDDGRIATILAHVAWVQVLRVQHDLAPQVPVDEVFDRALGADPNNTHANAMSAFWRLFQRRIGVEDVQLAEQRFAIALANDEDRAFVRRLQISRLARLGSSGRSEPVERAVLAAAIRACHSMMENGEPHPAPELRHRILDAYGFMGRATHVEAAVDALPPRQHLAVYAWLLDGLGYDEAHESSQALYVQARLTEAAGDRDRALALYRELLATERTASQLDARVDAAIERLTGTLPARATARDYRNDPIDERDPWRFHADTVANFDPGWRPTNFDQALDFFHDAVDRDDPRIDRLVARLPTWIDRVREVVRQGDAHEKAGSYTSGFSAGHHESARINLFRLLLLQADALVAAGELDRAIAILGDADRFLAPLGDRWAEQRAHIAFRLARAHALRAGRDGDQTDVTRAVEQLLAIVEANAVNGETASWEQITGDDFEALANDPGYQDLVRGR